MAVVGSGDFRYERVPTWPNMPKYWEFGPASDGAVNSKDEVHIFSRGDHPLTIWDKDGNFISSWGEGTFSANPHGIYIAPNDNVWLVDRDYHIATEYSPSGEILRRLGSKLEPSPSFVGLPFNMPSGLAIAPGREPVRLRRLRRPPRPQVFGGWRAPEVVGQAGNWAGRVRTAAQYLGGQEQPSLYRGPREQPDAAIHGRGGVHRRVD